MAHTVKLPDEPRMPPWVLLDLVGRTVQKLCMRMNLNMDVATRGFDTFIICDPKGELQIWEAAIREEFATGPYDQAIVRIILDMWYPQFTSPPGGSDAKE